MYSPQEAAPGGPARHAPASSGAGDNAGPAISRSSRTDLSIRRRAYRMAASELLNLQVTKMNKILAVLVLVAIGGLLGCSTIEGAGKDIQSGGKAVSDTAKDVRADM